MYRGFGTSAHVLNSTPGCYLDGGWLACLKDPVGYVGMGLKGRFKQARQVTSEEPDKKQHWSSRLGVAFGAYNPTPGKQKLLQKPHNQRSKRNSSQNNGNITAANENPARGNRSLEDESSETRTSIRP